MFVDLSLFFITLALSIVATTVFSRSVYLLLPNSNLGIRKVGIANCTSGLICWLIFALWLSPPGHFYWFAGHVTFTPQALWFMWDILHWDEDEPAKENQLPR